MRTLHAKRTLALAELLAALILSGCSHASGLEVAEGVGRGVFGVMAAGAIADCEDDVQPRNQAICENQTEAVMKFSQSVYRELKPAKDTPSAEELSNDLDTFIQQRRMPTVSNKDDTEEDSTR
ncbi:MAG: hypothetical protein P8Z33_11530 [Gammaproteobacteria bacterium]|jgi:hypothetical protein